MMKNKKNMNGKFLKFQVSCVRLSYLLANAYLCSKHKKQKRNYLLSFSVSPNDRNRENERNITIFVICVHRFLNMHVALLTNIFLLLLFFS